jgi:hypothetical protein
LDKNLLNHYSFNGIGYRRNNKGVIGITPGLIGSPKKFRICTKIVEQKGVNINKSPPGQKDLKGAISKLWKQLPGPQRT